jgi:hypothetical protein
MPTKTFLNKLHYKYENYLDKASTEKISLLAQMIKQNHCSF